jgi:methanesulfonate monooxygenase small subunit
MNARTQVVSDQAIRELVYRSCVTLDAEDFDAFLALCTPALHYRIAVWSPDIRKEMTWLEHDYEGMKALLAAVPHHLKRLGTMKRHASVYFIERAADGRLAEVTSSFLVVSTDPEGRSKLYIAGMYHDEVDLSSGRPLLARRRAQLETRDLGVGTHIPV